MSCHDTGYICYMDNVTIEPYTACQIGNALYVCAPKHAYCITDTLAKFGTRSILIVSM